jgi:hypothetical protein
MNHRIKQKNCVSFPELPFLLILVSLFITDDFCTLLMNMDMIPMLMNMIWVDGLLERYVLRLSSSKPLLLLL